MKNKNMIMYYLRFCKFYHIEADIVEQGERVRREAGLGIPPHLVLQESEIDVRSRFQLY